MLVLGILPFIYAQPLLLSTVYPTSDITVDKGDPFNATFNISCSSGSCGAVNVTVSIASTKAFFTVVNISDDDDSRRVIQRSGG